MICCDPETYDSIRAPEDLNLAVAVGIYPKKVAGLAKKKNVNFRDCCKSPMYWH